MTATRRSILAAAIAAPALAVAGNASAFAVSSAPDMAEWQRLTAAVDRAAVVMHAAGDRESEASEAYIAGLHEIGERPTPPTIHYPRPIADMTIGELRDMDCVIPAEAQRLYEAELAEWNAREGALNQRTNSDEIEAAWERAVDDHAAAAKALLAYPAPNADALIYKLKVIEIEWRGCDLCQDIQAHLFADIRRLAAREA